MFKKIILTILSVFIIASVSYAADTISAEIDKAADWSDGQRLYRVHLYFKSDGSNPAAFNLSTYLAKGKTNIAGTQTYLQNEWTKVEGGALYQIDTDPGTEPDGTYTLVLSSDLGATLLTLSALSATVTETHDASDDIGFFPIVFDISIDLGDIGSANDETNIYFYIVR